MNAETQAFRWEPFFLNSRDQGAVGLLLTAGFLGVLAYFGLAQFEMGPLVDIDDVSSQTAAYQVDLNSAAWPELVVLPGIGEKLSQSIVEYRQQMGSFRSPAELLEIRGIGDTKLAALKPHLIPISAAN